MGENAQCVDESKDISKCIFAVQDASFPANDSDEQTVEEDAIQIIQFK